MILGWGDGETAQHAERFDRLNGTVELLVPALRKEGAPTVHVYTKPSDLLLDGWAFTGRSSLNIGQTMGVLGLD